jgi:hypothetical protein
LIQRFSLRRPLIGSLVVAGMVSLSLDLGAQTLYVPVPDASALQATPQITLRLNNASAATRHANVSFVEEGQSGSAPGVTHALGVAANGASVADGSSLVSGAGLLVISGSPQVTATVEYSIANSAGGSDFFLPVIGEANQIAAKSTALVAGLERATGGGFANLEIVNLGSASTQCSVSLVNLDGSPAAAGATVTLPPVSMTSFTDVLSGSANPNPSNVTAEVTCDQAFYPYATIYSPSPAAFHIAVPSTTVGTGVGGSNTSSGGGTTSPGQPTFPPGAAVSVRRSGVFFAPVDSSLSALDIPIPVTPNGSYSQATVEFDMVVGAFTPHYTAIAALLRPGSSRNNRTLYFGFDIRGNVGRTFIDLGVVGLEPAIKSSYPWTEGSQYHIKLVYDVVQKILTLSIFQDGSQQAQVHGANFNWDLRDTGKGMQVQFGLPGVADGAYFPPIGWIFSNLSIEMTP